MRLSGNVANVRGNMKKKNMINCSREATRATSDPIGDQTKYREKCLTRRRGKRIEEKKEEGWVLKELFEGYNAAKRYIKNQKLRCYAEG
jgi:hypothetical protein